MTHLELSTGTRERKWHCWKKEIGTYGSERDVRIERNFGKRGEKKKQKKNKREREKEMEKKRERKRKNAFLKKEKRQTRKDERKRKALK